MVTSPEPLPTALIPPCLAATDPALIVRAPAFAPATESMPTPSSAEAVTEPLAEIPAAPEPVFSILTPCLTPDTEAAVIDMPPLPEVIASIPMALAPVPETSPLALAFTAFEPLPTILIP